MATWYKISRHSLAIIPVEVARATPCKVFVVQAGKERAQNVSSYHDTYLQSYAEARGVLVARAAHRHAQAILALKDAERDAADADSLPESAP